MRFGVTPFDVVSYSTTPPSLTVSALACYVRLSADHRRSTVGAEG